jgi:hypothetical protein
MPARCSGGIHWLGCRGPSAAAGPASDGQSGAAFHVTLKPHLRRHQLGNLYLWPMPMPIGWPMCGRCAQRTSDSDLAASRLARLAPSASANLGGRRSGRAPPAQVGDVIAAALEAVRSYPPRRGLRFCSPAGRSPKEIRTHALPHHDGESWQSCAQMR